MLDGYTVALETAEGLEETTWPEGEPSRVLGVSNGASDAHTFAALLSLKDDWTRTESRNLCLFF